MLASRPRRKKLIRIIIILSSRTETELNNDIDGSVYEVMTNQMAALKPQMEIDESNWNTAQNDVWAVIEDIDAQLTSDPTDKKKLAELSDTLETAIGNL